MEEIAKQEQGEVFKDVVREHFAIKNKSQIQNLIRKVHISAMEVWMKSNLKKKQKSPDKNEKKI